MSELTTSPSECIRRLNIEGAGALADLFSEYNERLTNMVKFRLDRRLYGRVDPADVVQEAYLDAAQRLAPYLADPEVPFHIWLRQIASQTLINVHRRHLGTKKRNAGNEINIKPQGFHASSISIAAQFVGHLTSPSQAAIKAETLGQLEAALEEMDEMDREVLVLRHFEELSNQETAEILGLQKSAASNRYVRALKRLRTVLEQFPGLFDG